MTAPDMGPSSVTPQKLKMKLWEAPDKSEVVSAFMKLHEQTVSLIPPCLG